MKTLHLEKNGIRGLSISESFTHENTRSVLAGVVMSNEFQIDGFVFEFATIKGDDITEKIISMYQKLNRDDISYILLPGTILSMYNIVNLEEILTNTQIPVIAVNSTDSSGLMDSIKNHFPEDFEKKLTQYKKLGPREKILLTTNNEIFVRAEGCTIKDCNILLNKLTLQGGIPEPQRVSQLLAKTMLKTYSSQ